MFSVNAKTPFSYFVIFFLVGSFLVACDGDQVDSEQSTQKARQFLEQRKLREAVLELKNALSGDPENGEARFLLGEINLELGDIATAEKEFRRAKRAAWSEEAVRLGMARALLNGKEYQKVVDDIEISPTYSLQTQADLYGLKAIALLSLGKQSEAQAALDKARSQDETALQAARAAIILPLARQDVDAAKQAVTAALQSHPLQPVILLLQAKVVMLENDVATAKQALQKVIDNDALKLVTVYGRKARLELANLELQQGNLDTTQTLIEPLIKQNPNDIKAGYLAGMLAFEQGDIKLADERLLAVLKIAPGYADAQLMYGAVCYANQDDEQAAYYLEKYISAVPQNLAARKLLGRTYLRQGQFSEARRILAPGLNVDDKDPELLTLISLSELEGGKPEEGVEGLESAAREAPESKVIRQQLLQAYLSQGEAEKAIASLKQEVQQGDVDTQSMSMLLVAYIREGKFEQAFAEVDDMLKAKPDDLAVLTQAGNVYAASGDFNKASEYLDRALALDPTYLPASMSLGNMEEIAGNYDNAMVIYKRLIDASEASVLPMLAMARVSGAMGDENAQLNWLQKAHQHAPRAVDPLLQEAEYYLTDKQLAQAKDRVNEALKLTPGLPRSLLLLGRVLVAGQSYNEALRPLNELVVKKPESIPARSLLAETYLKLGQTADAKRQLQTVLDQKPDHVPALALLAATELKTGNFDAALTHARRIQSGDTQSPVGFELAGDALLAKQRYSPAQKNYQQAWHRQPSATLAIKLSEVSQRLGQMSSAAEPLERWLEKSPDDVYARRFLAVAYYKMGRHKDAIEQFEQVLAQQPDNFVAMNNIAVIYTRTADPRALDYAERAYKLSQKDPGILDTYGWSLLQQGQAKQGRKILQQALDMMPTNNEIRYHYAAALLETGEAARGKLLLQDLLSSNTSFEGRKEAQRLLQSMQ